MSRLKAPKDFDWSEQNKEQSSFKETQIFHFLNNLHQTLRQRFSWYNLYHSLPNVSFLNLGILILSFVLFFAYTFPYISITLLPQEGRILGASWYNYNWQYRDTITIDNTNNTEALTDYQVLLDEGEVGYWKFDEGSGTTASDSSGLKNNGTINGEATWTSGKYGGALELDGGIIKNDSPDSLPRGNTSKTLALWFKKSSSCATCETLGGFGNTASGENFQIELCQSGNFWVLGWGIDTDWNTGISSSSYRDGEWHFVVVTYDASSHTTRLYVDNVLLASTTSYTFAANPQKIIFGDEIDEEGRAYHGLLDEPRIYNRALSAEEIQYLYQNNRSPLLGDVYQYTQEDGDDLRFADSDGTTLLNHYTELYTASGQNAKIWIKVPEIPASSTKDIYVYFGNASATSGSNGDNVFIFFDDFESYDVESSIDGQGGWSINNPSKGQAIIQEEGGNKYLDIDSTSCWFSLKNETPDFYNHQIVEIRLKPYSATFDFALSDGNTTSSGEPYNGYDWRYGAGSNTDRIQRWINGSWAILASSSSTYPLIGRWQTVKGVWSGSSLESYVDNVRILSSTDSTYSSQTAIQLETGCTASWDVDWIRVREYIPPEPVLSLGNNLQEGDQTPPTNPANITAYDSSSKNTQLTSGNWYNYSHPYFEFSGAQDPESGIAGYYIYWGTDENADPLTAGTYQAHQGEANDTQTYTVSSDLTLGQTYYFRLRTKNSVGLSSDAATLFTYKFDNQSPDPPEYVNVSPLGCSTTSTFTFTWPEASDSVSGVAGYEYKLGSQGTIQWAGNVTELEASPYQEGDNVFYHCKLDILQTNNKLCQSL